MANKADHVNDSVYDCGEIRGLSFTLKAHLNLLPGQLPVMDTIERVKCLVEKQSWWKHEARHERPCSQLLHNDTIFLDDELSLYRTKCRPYV